MHNPSSKLSLEARLTGAEGVLRHIHGLLDDLFEAVEDVMTLALPRFQTDVDEAAAADNGNPLDQALLDEDQNEEGNDEADDGDDVFSAESLMEEMSDALRGLFRAGVLVRKASARDRFAHALKASRGQFLGQFDIEYAEQKFSKLRRLREESAWLTRRLGSANSKRRQVQKYYRDHKLRLAAGEQTSREEDESRTEKLSSKATTLMPGQLQLRLLQDTLPEDENDDAISLTSAVTTFEQGATLKLPRLALLSPDGEPFECPICFVLCACATEKSWKIHAYNDIRPYICTLGGPECEELMFPDRNSWFQHELSEHRSTFVCAICSANGFDTMAKFKDHVLVHGQLAGEQVNDLLAAGRQVQHEFGASACPFCVEWEDARGHRGSGRVTGPQLKRHVATHLEQLALFSVPREVICGPEDSQAGSSGGSGGSIPNMGTISFAVDPSSDFLADLPDAEENETEGIARHWDELAEKERKNREVIEATRGGSGVLLGDLVNAGDFRVGSSSGWMSFQAAMDGGRKYQRHREDLVNAGVDEKYIEAITKKQEEAGMREEAKDGFRQGMDEISSSLEEDLRAIEKARANAGQAAKEQFEAVRKTGENIMESGAGNSQDQRESSVIIEADETGPSDALESSERPKMDFGGQQVATAGASFTACFPAAPKAVRDRALERERARKRPADPPSTSAISRPSPLGGDC
ncbi:hypothetical protein GGTG_01999 [Gaeumannomyces tritici R3-111a-1]|uniref:Oxidoreductase acuF-like C2H2 type zinc-finger domain-containing protein n=1 Tax=Gaeumannomyces tritici (strain R3-111a-1) TaxID=644352 RepID=J3NL58_GAET3|nr:hypothetical protein GGTG_01999 [Gaeumannomyces tritici R3-111a-1]EJT82025.1 hypothetical protein GGTG_01999 [Gaeumannomyces tritici R3-111a-1]